MFRRRPPPPAKPRLTLTRTTIKLLLSRSLPCRVVAWAPDGPGSSYNPTLTVWGDVAPNGDALLAVLPAQRLGEQPVKVQVTWGSEARVEARIDLWLCRNVLWGGYWSSPPPGGVTPNRLLKT